MKCPGNYGTKDKPTAKQRRQENCTTSCWQLPLLRKSRGYDHPTCAEFNRVGTIQPNRTYNGACYRVDGLYGHACRRSHPFSSFRHDPQCSLGRIILISRSLKKPRRRIFFSFICFEYKIKIYYLYCIIKLPFTHHYNSSDINLSKGRLPFHQSYKLY